MVSKSDLIQYANELISKSLGILDESIINKTYDKTHWRHYLGSGDNPYEIGKISKRNNESIHGGDQKWFNELREKHPKEFKEYYDGYNAQ